MNLKSKFFLLLRYKSFFAFIFSLLFFFLNCVLLFLVFLLHNSVQIHSFNYFNNAHHYFADPQLTGSFNFVSSLSQYDSQWYLKIAAEGYPYHPTSTNLGDKSQMDGPTYAFFPLYPVFLHFFSFLISIPLEFSAFILSLLFFIVLAYSLLYVLSHFSSNRVAFFSTFLLLFSPLSIFFRSYYPEALYLIILLWFSYFWLRKQYLISAIFLSISFLARGNGFLLVFPFLYDVFYLHFRRFFNFRNVLIFAGLIILPFLCWSMYVFSQTGNPFYFMWIQSSWSPRLFFAFTFLSNILLFYLFPFLPFHDFHYSQFELWTFLFVVLALVLSFKKLPWQLWIISFLFAFTPLFVKDWQSYSRFQSISFPLFLFVGYLLSTRNFIIAASLSFCLLVFVGILFTNWYWIG